MEKISVKVDLPTSIKKYEEEQYKVLSNSEFMKKYLQDHNMTEEDLRKNLPIFVMMMREIKECESCGGLENCLKSEKGFIPLLKKKHFIDFEKTPCKYMQMEM